MFFAKLVVAYCFLLGLLVEAKTVAKVGDSADNKPFDGYIVTARWNGGTFPSEEWALDVTRQDVDFRFKQTLQLANLLPTTAGPALSPTYTAYDPATRAYFTTVRDKDNASALLWGHTILADVSNATAFAKQVSFKFTTSTDVLSGLFAWGSGNATADVKVFALFQSGVLLEVDVQTGATTLVATLTTSSQVATTAAVVVQESGTLYVIVQQKFGNPARCVVAVDLASKAVSSIPIQKTKGHDDPQQTVFEMVWLPSLKQLMMFLTGSFDQLVYLDPTTGVAEFAIEDLTQKGNYEFYANDSLEDDDTWANAAVDVADGKIYYQCTEVNPEDDDTTTSLCFSPIQDDIKKNVYVDIAISPMTYGYAGMQWVAVEE